MNGAVMGFAEKPQFDGKLAGLAGYVDISQLIGGPVASSAVGVIFSWQMNFFIIL